MKDLSTIGFNLNRLLYSIYKASRLHAFLNHMIGLAPKSIQTHWENQKVRNRIRMRDKLVPEKELSDKYRETLRLLLERNGAQSLGDYLEFGVYNGSSILCMYRVVQEFGFNQMRLFGFDSFEGLPETASIDDDGNWYPGQFRCSYEFTKTILEKESINFDKIILTKGWFSDTLNDELIDKYNITNASVIMIDCDMYLSAKEALKFCAPLIQKEAVILFDDWYSGNRLADRNLGEKRAFDEFLSENPYFKTEELNSYAENAKVFLITRVR